MITMLLNFFSSTLGKWSIILLLISATYATGYVKGISHEQLNQKQATAVYIIKAAKIADKIHIRVIKEKADTIVKFKTIEKEVIKYKTTVEAAKTCIDNEFVNLYNRSVDEKGE